LYEKSTLMDTLLVYNPSIVVMAELIAPSTAAALLAEVMELPKIGLMGQRLGGRQGDCQSGDDPRDREFTARRGDQQSGEGTHVMMLLLQRHTVCQYKTVL
jgi:hypothetical protein